MANTLVLFDFDGTITTKDTFLELIKFHKGKNAFYKGMSVVAPYIALYKARLIKAQTLKEKVLQQFFRGMPLQQFNGICASFTQQVLPGLIRPKAIEQIQEYRHKLYDIAVVSASAENWVQPFCGQYSLTCIATKLEVVDGKLTGKLNGINCKGAEKVCRVKEVYDVADYNNIIVYGDSSGDADIIKLSTTSFYKPFRN